MKSLKANFLKTRKSNPYWSDFICIANVVKKRHFDNQVIKKNFEELVDKTEYENTNKKQILHFLYSLTNSRLRGE